MTILYPTPAPVKSARRFGAGILPSRPVYHAPYTQADLDWVAADNARREAENAHYDAMAEESAALTRYERGIVYC